MTTLLTPLRHMIAARTPRERRLIVLAALAISLASVSALAEWTWREHQRLTQQLPEAHARLAKMQDDASELARLNRLPTPAPVPLATLARAADAAASSRGLTFAVESAGNTLQVSGTGPFQAVIDWLATVQRDQKLRPQQVVIEVIDSGVRLEAVLIMPANEH